MTNSRSMTEGKPLRVLTLFAAPMLLTNVLQLVYSLVDSAVVGRALGVRAFAAVGSTASLHWMCQSVAIGLSIGFETIFAQRFGAKDRIGLRKALATASLLSFLAGGMLACFGVFFGRRALILMGTPPTLIDGAFAYLGWMLGGAPITMFSLLTASSLRALGNSKTPLRSNIVSTAINVVLDIALVPIFGIPGAAAATLIAQLSAGAQNYAALRAIPEARVGVSDVDAGAAKVLLAIGLPLAFRNAVIEIGGLFCQTRINIYGETFVAGMAAAYRMYALLCVAAGAVEGSVGVFVAQNYGAGRFDRISRGVRAGFAIMLSSAILIGSFAFVFAENIIGLFVTGEPALLAETALAGGTQMRVMAFGLPFLCALFLYRVALQGMGNRFWPMASGFIELIARLSAIFILVPIVGKWGVHVNDALGWVCAAPVLYLAYRVSYAARSRAVTANRDMAL